MQLAALVRQLSLPLPLSPSPLIFTLTHTCHPPPSPGLAALGPAQHARAGVRALPPRSAEGVFSP